MKFFDNLLDVDLRDGYLVAGLNKELNSIYIYEYGIFVPWIDYSYYFGSC